MGCRRCTIAFPIPLQFEVKQHRNGLKPFGGQALLPRSRRAPLKATASHGMDYRHVAVRAERWPFAERSAFSSPTTGSPPFSLHEVFAFIQAFPSCRKAVPGRPLAHPLRCQPRQVRAGLRTMDISRRPSRPTLIAAKWLGDPPFGR
jgi:hypothetical protein